MDKIVIVSLGKHRFVAAGYEQDAWIAVDGRRFSMLKGVTGHDSGQRSGPAAFATIPPAWGAVRELRVARQIEGFKCYVVTKSRGTLQEQLAAASARIVELEGGVERAVEGHPKVKELRKQVADLESARKEARDAAETAQQKLQKGLAEASVELEKLRDAIRVLVENLARAISERDTTNTALQAERERSHELANRLQGYMLHEGLEPEQGALVSATAVVLQTEASVGESARHTTVRGAEARVMTAWERSREAAAFPHKPWGAWEVQSGQAPRPRLNLVTIRAAEFAAARERMAQSQRGA